MENMLGMCLKTKKSSIRGFQKTDMVWVVSNCPVLELSFDSGRLRSGRVFVQGVIKVRYVFEAVFTAIGVDKISIKGRIYIFGTEDYRIRWGKW